MAAWIFRSLFRRSRNRPQTIPQLLKIPKQKRPSFRKNGRAVLLCLYFELEGRLFWFLFGAWGNTRVKIKRKEMGLKLILMTGRPAKQKSAKNRARAHWKRGVSPSAGACLAAVAWHYCYNGTLYACRAAACGWPPSQVEHAQRIKIAILPIMLPRVRALTYGWNVPALFI